MVVSGDCVLRGSPWGTSGYPPDRDLPVLRLQRGGGEEKLWTEPTPARILILFFFVVFLLGAEGRWFSAFFFWQAIF